MPLRLANPARTEAVDLDGVSLVLVRLLGGRRAWEGLDALLADAGAAGRAGRRARRRGRRPRADRAVDRARGRGRRRRRLPARGRPGQPARARGVPVRHRAAHRPRLRAGRRACRAYGLRAGRAGDPARPTVGVVYYRAHELSGNTGFVDVLCDAVEAAGANARPVYVPSLRPDADGRGRGGGGAAGRAGRRARRHRARRRRLERLRRGGLGRPRADRARRAGAAGAVRHEQPGRLGGLRRRARADRRRDAGRDPGVRRPAGRCRLLVQGDRRGRRAGVRRRPRAGRARRGHRRRARPPRRTCRTPTSGSRWCCRATRPSTPGSATPSASTPRPARCTCCGRCARPATTSRQFPEDGDELVHTLIAAGGHDVEWLTEDQLRAAVARVPLAAYEAWFADAAAGAARRDARALGAAAREPLRRRRRDRAGGAAVRERRAHDPAAARLRREPDRDLPRPGPAAVAPLPGGLPLARDARGRRRLRRARGRPPGQARHAGVAARQGARPVGVLRARRRARRPAAVLPVHRQRPGRGHAGQAPRPRHRRRPPRAADGARGVLRRDGPARAAARRVRPGAGDGPGQAAGPARSRSGSSCRRRSCTTTCT